MTDSAARYDKTCHIYNWTFDIPYWRIRRTALDCLNLMPGDVVLDMGCGTGVNFDSIVQRTGAEVTIYAVDASPGMLHKAQAKISQRGWRAQVHMVHAPMEKINLRSFDFADPVKVIFALSLTVIGDWNAAFNHVFTQLPAGSCIVIMDIHRKVNAFGGRFLDWIAASDTTRAVWTELERQGQGFEFIEFRRPFKIFDVDMFVARAIK